MPKTIYMPKPRDGIITDWGQSSGIEITWTPSAQRLDISGWYDHGVGIESTAMTLAEFLDRLGITEKDARKAFAKSKEAEG